MKTTKSRLFAALAVGMMLCVANSAFALETPQISPTRSSAGIFGGLSFVGNSNGTKVGIGADANHRFDEVWGFGFYFDYISLGSTIASVNGVPFTLSTNIVHVMLEGNYYFPGAFEGLHAGLKIGPAFTSGSNNGANIAVYSGTDVAYGLTAAYDINIGHDFTAGPELNVLQSTQSNGPTIVNAVAVLKLFF